MLDNRLICDPLGYNKHVLTSDCMLYARNERKEVTGVESLQVSLL
jgi:hypothetical protein